MYLNIARIEPATKHLDVGGYVNFNTEGSRAYVYLNPQFTGWTDWTAGAIVEEAFHQSQRNNKQPACGRLAEYTAALVRFVFAESSGIGANFHQIREWESISDEPCFAENAEKR